MNLIDRGEENGLFRLRSFGIYETLRLVVQTTLKIKFLICFTIYYLCFPFVSIFYSQQT